MGVRLDIFICKPYCASRAYTKAQSRMFMYTERVSNQLGEGGLSLILLVVHLTSLPYLVRLPLATTLFIPFLKSI